MNLPKLMTDFVDSQNNYDGAAFASLFTDSAEVFDEGKTHVGRPAIQKWIKKSSEEYKATVTPVSYEEGENGSVFRGEVSGTFPGSPLILSYNMVLQNGLIQSLKITG